MVILYIFDLFKIMVTQNKNEYMNEDVVKDRIGFVKLSPYRLEILKYLETGMKMPVEIGKHLDIRTSHASNVLQGLSKNGLVVCINPHRKKGRLYENTELAKEVLKYFD